MNPAGDIVDIETDIPHAEVDQSATILSGIVIPGMPNLHSHAHQRAMAGLGEKSGGGADSFWAWRQAMYHYLERIRPQQLYDIARMLYVEMLLAGYTHVGEFQYLHHDTDGHRFNNPAEMTLQCLWAAQNVGIGCTALPVLYAYGGFGEVPAEAQQRRFINDADGFMEIVAGAQGELTCRDRIGIAPHSLRAIGQALLTEVIATTGNDQVVHIHIAEQVKEVEDCVAWSGLRPVEWLYDHFSIDRRWCLIHATRMTEAETKKVAASHAMVGLCPTIEANLGDGLFPAPLYLSHGGQWGIGSDSHISISPVEELRWLEYGQRLVARERNLLVGEGRAEAHTGYYLYTQAATGGASACGIPAGAIEVGKRADFVVLDESHSRLCGRIPELILDNYIFSGNAPMVADVIVAGRHVIKESSHPKWRQIKAQYQKTLTSLGQS